MRTKPIERLVHIEGGDQRHEHERNQTDAGFLGRVVQHILHEEADLEEGRVATGDQKENHATRADDISHPQQPGWQQGKGMPVDVVKEEREAGDGEADEALRHR